MTLTPEAVDLLGRLEAYGVRLGLETTRGVLGALGQPQRSFPSVLIAGTNGKGSTAALLAAMASAAGYCTGLYTSPHLEDVEERIRIDGQAVPGGWVSEGLVRVVQAAERALGHLPTYFEALTAAAFQIFADQRVDLAVLEVGLGGRLDATNVSEPVLSLITEIGLEHRQFLGQTVESIAQEKAGILRGGCCAVAWTERPEVRRTLRRRARELGARLVIGPEVAAVSVVEETGWEGQRLELRTPVGDYRMRMALLGRHQAKNLALAALGAEELVRQGWKGLDRRAVVQGAAACRWPGRLERVVTPDGVSVLLDAAHNPDGARALSRFLEGRGTSYDLLFGALADKEVERVFPPLARLARRVVLTAPDTPRAIPPESLRRVLGCAEAVVRPESAAALSAALDGVGDLLVVCGSIYLAGEIRALLRQRFGTPQAAKEVSLYDSES
ncbi:MAG: folylpolyglutamate synthase/dihydrofolate synthase family protein [Thermoanaerobaculia bacterium]